MTESSPFPFSLLQRRGIEAEVLIPLIRRLEQERDELRKELQIARNELRQRDGVGNGTNAPVRSGDFSREVARLEARIAALEAEQTQLTAALADPATYTERAQEVGAMTERLAQVERDIDMALSRWEELEQRAAAAAGRSV